jgi:hypothetical protein
MAAPLFAGAVHARLIVFTPAPVEEKTTIAGTAAGVFDDMGDHTDWRPAALEAAIR